ncbi:MAG TPA: FAD-binding protein, partial [Chthonomonadaceae bacterium]|nr:FAD-binding protein [Chthonomonadaceae bacterium]
FTSNSWECSGDGAAMAYEAGADLLDMEFVQFHPTGMIWPPGARGILVTEAVRGEGGLLFNAEGSRFMLDYDPVKKELSSRDVVARSIYKEVQAGRGSTHHGAYLDIRHRGADYIKKKLPSMYEQFHALGGVDITVEPMEIYPTIHYTMGGVWADPETCATTVAGLYAAGEVAAGLHGANRLGGNSLSDIMVFGRRAGMAAAEFAKSVAHAEVSTAQIEPETAALLAPLNRTSGENPYKIHQELQEAMQTNCMIARTEKGLLACLEKILELQTRAENLAAPGDRRYNPGWHAARDLRFMLRTSEIIVRCALERKESRGAQWRLDYPNRDDGGWGKKNLIATLGTNGVAITTRPLPEMPAELKALIEEGK